MRVSVSVRSNRVFVISRFVLLSAVGIQNWHSRRSGGDSDGADGTLRRANYQRAFVTRHRYRAKLAVEPIFAKSLLFFLLILARSFATRVPRLQRAQHAKETREHRVSL